MGFNNTDRKLITTKAKVLMQQNYLYTPERSLATWPFIEQKILEGKKAYRIRYFGQGNKNMAMIRSGVHRYVITGPTNRQIKSWDSHPVENIQHPSKTDANERESTNDSRSFSLTPNFDFR